MAHIKIQNGMIHAFISRKMAIKFTITESNLAPSTFANTVKDAAVTTWSLNLNLETQNMSKKIKQENIGIPAPIAW